MDLVLSQPREQGGRAASYGGRSRHAAVLIRSGHRQVGAERPSNPITEQGFWRFGARGEQIPLNYWRRCFQVLLRPEEEGQISCWSQGFARLARRLEEHGTPMSKKGVRSGKYRYYSSIADNTYSVEFNRRANQATHDCGGSLRAPTWYPVALV